MRKISLDGGLPIKWDGRQFKYVIQEYNYKGENCYAIRELTTGWDYVFDKNEVILMQLLNEINNNGMSLERNATDESGYPLCYLRFLKKHRLSLLKYLGAKYTERSLKAVRECHVERRNKEAQKERIMDYRSSNIYFYIDEMRRKVYLINRPGHPDEQYIVIHDRYTEIYDYSEELYKMLSSEHRFSIESGGHRLSATVTSKNRGQTKSTRIYLSRLVLMFYHYSKRFKTYKRFLNAVPKIINDWKNFGFECGHINACVWNGSRSNMIPMSKSTNVRMSNIITKFVGFYNAFAIAVDEDDHRIILVKVKTGGKDTYYKCETPEEYCDLQQFLYSKTGKNVELFCKVYSEGELYSVGSPNKIFNSLTSQSDDDKYIMTEEETISAFWEYLDERDSLLEEYSKRPELFTHWWKNNSMIAVSEKMIPFAFNIAESVSGQPAQSILLECKAKVNGGKCIPVVISVETVK